MDTIIDAILPTFNVFGEIWECGTFRGDNALRIKGVLEANNDNRVIRMFDTFTGQPFSGPNDTHQQGSMNGTSIDIIQRKFKDKSNYFINSGIMPFTFSGLENTKLSLVNIDVDNYNSVKDCLEFVYPRTEISGFIFFDDYGCPHCPGARKAVDEFLKDKIEILSGHAPAFIMKQ
jgi:O-methyltransferase